MISILGILICAIASIILGSIWYGPLFGKLWMKLMKIKKPKVITPKIKKMMMKSYSITLLASIVTAIILSGFVNLTTSLLDALSISFLVWLGFLATTMIGSITWEGRPFKLYLLNISYHLSNLLVMTIILYYI